MKCINIPSLIKSMGRELSENKVAMRSRDFTQPICYKSQFLSKNYKMYVPGIFSNDDFSFDCCLWE